MRRHRSMGPCALRCMRNPIALPSGATSPDTSMTNGGSGFSRTASVSSAITKCSLRRTAASFCPFAKSGGQALASAHARPRDRPPPSIDRLPATRQPNIHAVRKPDPVKEASLGHGNQHWNIGLEGLRDGFDQSPAFGLGAAKAIDHDEVGAVVGRGCQPVGELAEPLIIKSAASCIVVFFICDEAEGFPARQHDDAQFRLLCPATAAGLDDADRTNSRTAEVAGEIDEETVGVVISTVDHRGEIALSIEPHAAHLMKRYIWQNISPGMGWQAY